MNFVAYGRLVYNSKAYGTRNNRDYAIYAFAGLQLPINKCKTIKKDINKILKKKQVFLKKFQKLAGKLQHASLGIPGGAGLFSPIQMAILQIILTDWR